MQHHINIGIGLEPIQQHLRVKGGNRNGQTGADADQRSVAGILCCQYTTLVCIVTTISCNDGCHGNKNKQ